MHIENHYLGNVKITKTNKEVMLKKIKECIDLKMKTRLFYLNAHCFNVSQKDPIYLSHLNEAEFVLNDGIGIELGARIFGIKFVENLNGTDFTPEILKIAEVNGYTIFLLGGEDGIAKVASEKLQEKLPKLKIVGYSNGFFENTDVIIHKINDVRPDILIVGLGVPYQEVWISENSNKLNVTLLTGVGAFLDFTSNKVSRAPYYIRKLKLEWLYRLMLEPKRMWKRYLVGNCKFFYYILKLRF